MDDNFFQWLNVREALDDPASHLARLGISHFPSVSENLSNVLQMLLRVGLDLRGPSTQSLNGQGKPFLHFTNAEELALIASELLKCDRPPPPPHEAREQRGYYCREVTDLNIEGRTDEPVVRSLSGLSFRVTPLDLNCLWALISWDRAFLCYELRDYDSALELYGAGCAFFSTAKSMASGYFPDVQAIAQIPLQNLQQNNSAQASKRRSEDAQRFRDHVARLIPDLVKTLSPNSNRSCSYAAELLLQKVRSRLEEDGVKESIGLTLLRKLTAQVRRSRPDLATWMKEASKKKNSTHPRS